MLGNEAIASGLVEAGVRGVFAYPGTPSSEIAQSLIDLSAKHGFYAEWSVNEKVAYENAYGVSLSGRRSAVIMKHVGLNVASDAFMTSAYTGTVGGMVIIVADDPYAHSSQNEQDSRFYGKYSYVPVFEPSNQQEAYDIVFDAFELSEKYKIPVLLRITTRLAHSRSDITRRQAEPEKNLGIPADPLQFVLLPALARKKYDALISSYELLMFDNRIAKYNYFKDGRKRKLGIIACGIAYNYLMESIDSDPGWPVLKIAAYPFPGDLIRDLTSRCEEILVLEEGYPIVEESLRGMLDNSLKIMGRMDDVVPRTGELNPTIVAKAIGMPSECIRKTPEMVKKRPPSFCKGCGHADTFDAIIEALTPFNSKGVFSDIGCYTLAALPPYNIINSCVDMGASVTMAVGAADAGMFPSVAVIGDSTFIHSGMTGLLDAVSKRSPVTIIISDNSTTGMTGGQKSLATGRLENICKGLGVEPEHFRVITPLRKNHDSNVRIMKEEFAYRGVSVIVSARECIQTASKRRKAKNDGDNEA